MVSPVLLSNISDALNGFNDYSYYYDTENNTTVWTSPSDDCSSEKDLTNLLENDKTGRFIEISKPYNFENTMMEEFVESLPDGETKESLRVALSCRGAMKFFRVTIIRAHLEKDWHTFRDLKYREEAIWWCDSHKISYVEDKKS